jgi:hypothetical protein
VVGKNCLQLKVAEHQQEGEGYALRKEAQAEADEEAQAPQEAQEDEAQEQVARPLSFYSRSANYI